MMRDVNFINIATKWTSSRIETFKSAYYMRNKALCVQYSHALPVQFFSHRQIPFTKSQTPRPLQLSGHGLEGDGTAVDVEGAIEGDCARIASATKAKKKIA